MPGAPNAEAEPGALVLPKADTVAGLLAPNAFALPKPEGWPKALPVCGVVVCEPNADG